MPTGWRTSVRGDGRTVATAPGGFPDLLIELQAKAGQSAIGAWRDLEPTVRLDTDGYRLLSIRPADGGDGTTAAIWEFTFTSGGRTIHVIDLGMIRNGHGYALRWRVPDDGWQAAVAQLRTIVGTFRPGP